MKSSLIIGSLLFSLSLFSQTSLAPFKVKVLSMKNIPYEGDKVLFIAKKTKKVFSGISDKTGSFSISLPAGDVYDIQLKSIGEEIEYNTIEVPSLNEGESFTEGELIIQYEAGKNFTLNNVQFETASAVLKKECYSLFDDLIELMKLKKTMQISLEGHTDSDGTDEANLTLSKARAESVKNYLVSKGVDVKRIKTNGFGESKPISSNDTSTGKVKNRRLEVKVL